MWMTWILKIGEQTSLASNSGVSLFTKFEVLSDVMTVAIPVCINKSLIASHTSLASNLFSGCTAGHRVQLSMIQRQYLLPLDDGGSMGPIQFIVMC